jgi:hypothetical protein
MMGREIQCRMKSGGKWFQGKALLETSEIIFRGEQRLKIPFHALKSVVASDGDLRLKWAGNSVAFELGEQSAKWAHAILHPKTTADKLGIKPGLILSAVHLPGDATMQDARKTVAAFSNKKPLVNSDMIFFGATTASDLGGVQETHPLAACKRSHLGRLSQGPQRHHRAASPQRRTRGRLGGH